MKNTNFEEIAKLVERTKDGDKSAFSDIYSEYLQKIYFLCLELLKSPQDAQDATQEIFLNAFEKINTLEDSKSFDRWIFVSATRKCADICKRKSPKLFSEFNDSKITDFTQDDDIFISSIEEEQLVEKEIANKLNELIKSLPYKLRSAVLCYYFANMSVAEIADAEGVSESVIQNRLFNARQKLREKIKESGDDEKLNSALSILPLALNESSKNIKIPKNLLSATSTLSPTAKTGFMASAGAKIAVIAASVAIVASVAVGAYIISNKSDDKIDNNVGTPEPTTINAQDLNTESVVERVANNITFQGEKFKLPFKREDLRSDITLEQVDDYGDVDQIDYVGYINGTEVFSVSSLNFYGEETFVCLYVETVNRIKNAGEDTIEYKKDFSFDGVKIGDTREDVIKKFGEPDDEWTLEDTLEGELSYGDIESKYGGITIEINDSGDVSAIYIAYFGHVPIDTSNSPESKEGDKEKITHMDTTAVAYINHAEPFEIEDYIYYFDDAYLDNKTTENGEFDPFGVHYNSLYRIDKSGKNKEKIYSGKDIGVYNFGYADDYTSGDFNGPYIYKDCIYIINNIANNVIAEEAPKVIKISLKTKEATPLFEDVLKEKYLDVGLESENLKIYKGGLFYLKLSADYKEDADYFYTPFDLYYTTEDGETNLVYKNVDDAYILVDKYLLLFDIFGETTYLRADAPYKETEEIEKYDMERDPETDSTGNFEVTWASRANDIEMQDMYKRNIYTGETTPLRSGYIANCSIINDTIFYTEFIDGVGKVYTMDLDGKNIRKLSK